VTGFVARSRPRGAPQLAVVLSAFGQAVFLSTVIVRGLSVGGRVSALRKNDPRQLIAGRICHPVLLLSEPSVASINSPFPQRTIPYQRPTLAVSLPLLGLSFAATVLTFAGCASTSTMASPLATDAALIDTGLTIVTPVILASKGITPAEVNAVSGALTSVHTAATTLESGSSMTSRQAIIAGVQAVADVASKCLPTGSQEALAVTATRRLAVLFLPPGTDAPGPTPTMTVTLARGVLTAVRE
jgi:hypothetical protein